MYWAWYWVLPFGVLCMIVGAVYGYVLKSWLK